MAQNWWIAIGGLALLVSPWLATMWLTAAAGLLIGIGALMK